MKIRIAANGLATDSESGKRLGNFAQRFPAELAGTSRLHLEIELPNFHCNVGGTDPLTGQPACLVCPRNLPDFRPETDRVDAVCRNTRGIMERVAVLRFSGVAEPFWKGRIFELLAGLGVGPTSDLKVFVTTNGTLLDETVTEKWFATVPSSEIAFSIDATRPSTYVKLRRIAEFEKVVRQMDHYCRTRNPDRHVAVLCNQVNLINLDEVPRMVQMTRDHFLHYLQLCLTRPVGRGLEEICLNDRNVEAFRRARREASEQAMKLGVNVVFGSDWPA